MDHRESKERSDSHCVVACFLIIFCSEGVQVLPDTVLKQVTRDGDRLKVTTSNDEEVSWVSCVCHLCFGLYC